MTTYWLRLVVAHVWGVETTWAFTYFDRELVDPSSGYWRIAYRAFDACVGTFILFEVYDSYHL